MSDLHVFPLNKYQKHVLIVSHDVWAQHSSSICAKMSAVRLLVLASPAAHHCAMAVLHCLNQYSGVGMPTICNLIEITFYHLLQNEQCQYFSTCL